MARSASSPVVLVAPDRASAAHVTAALRRERISPAATIDGARGWADRATAALARRRSPVLLLVPAARMGRALLDLVETAVERGGSVFAWSTAAPGSSVGEADDRLVERLLEQRGALTDPRLSVVVEAARISAAVGAASLARIRVARSSDPLAVRMAASLACEGVQPARGRSRRDGIVGAGADGAMHLAFGARKRVELTGVDVAAGALALIMRAQAPAQPRSSKPEPAPDAEAVDLIARPPRRVLSETTSKRLLAAYGISAGPERLCGSPTEAARFWSEIGRPVVLKLVRPALEDKLAGGAVISTAGGAAAVRRAYHALEAVADTLGPPKPLGVLVAEQLEGGARVWLRLEKHRRFGALVVGGIGDSSTSSPSLAMTAPVSNDAAYAALTNTGLDPDRCAHLALAVTRFGTLVHDLRDRIERAEVHPLVALEGRDQALALDALVEISG